MVPKKLTTVVLALALTLVLAACGSSKKSDHHGIGNPMSGDTGRWADSSVTFTGTYLYGAGALILFGDTASDNVVCPGDYTGPGVLPTRTKGFAVTTLDAHTMILENDTTRIYKCEGTCTDILGTWTTRPKAYPWERDTITINSDFSFHSSIASLNCASTSSEYDCDTSHSYLYAWVADPMNLITSVTLSGTSTDIGTSDIDLVDAPNSGWYISANSVELNTPPEPTLPFTLTIVEGATTYTVKDHQHFYGASSCPVCVSPRNGEELPGGTVQMVWRPVPKNSHFVRYFAEVNGPNSFYYGSYDRTDTSATFGGLDLSSIYDMYIYTDYTGWDDTKRYCGVVKTPH